METYIHKLNTNIPFSIQEKGHERPLENEKAFGEQSRGSNKCNDQKRNNLLLDNLKNYYESRIKSSQKLVKTLEDRNNYLQETVDKQKNLIDEIKTWKEHWHKEINSIIVRDNYYVSSDTFRNNLKSVIDSIPNASTSNYECISKSFKSNLQRR